MMNVSKRLWKRSLLMVIAFLFLLAGCSTKTEDEIMKERYDAFVHHTIATSHWIDSNYDGTSTYTFEKGKEKYVYEFASINEQNEYQVIGMKYYNEEIADEITYYAVSYPEKTEDTSEVTEDNKEKVAELKQAFEKSMQTYDITWEELDEMVSYYRNHARLDDFRIGR